LPASFHGGLSSTGAGFLQVLQFPSLSFIPSIAQQSKSIYQGWYNMPINGLSTSGLGSTPAKRERGHNLQGKERAVGLYKVLLLPIPV
jgi:hypothetical protein